MSANASVQFQAVVEKGWRRGLGNLLQGEYSAWFKSSKWWKHLIMWFLIINLMMMIRKIRPTAMVTGKATMNTFIWGMAGENQTFTDMDAVPMTALK